MLRMGLIVDGRLPAAADAPPFDVMRTSRVELFVTDLAESRRFYVDLLGFAVTRESDDALHLRAYEDRHDHCLVLRSAPAPRVGAIGFRVRTERDLDQAARFYAERGCPTEWRPADDGARTLRTMDPLGFQIELHHAAAPAELLLWRYDRHHGARPARIDHVNLMVPDVEVALPHYFALGFRCSEFIATDPPDEHVVGAWMFRKPDVHDVSFTTSRGPRLHHVGVYVPDAMAILHACDALAAAGFAPGIERGPGRHGVSTAYFVYLRDPDGHRIELVTPDYYTGDPDLEPVRWSTSDPMRRTFWGHHVPDSWYEEGSTTVDLAGADVPLTAPARDERLAAGATT
jgi:3,4-dihydroxyphenylacetate 2,3-dioxygenase